MFVRKYMCVYTCIWWYKPPNAQIYFTLMFLLLIGPIDNWLFLSHINHIHSNFDETIDHPWLSAVQLGLIGFIAAMWSCWWSTPRSVLSGLLWSADCMCLGTFGTCANPQKDLGFAFNSGDRVEWLHNSSWLQTARCVLCNLCFGMFFRGFSQRIARVPDFLATWGVQYLELDWCLVASNDP